MLAVIIGVMIAVIIAVMISVIIVVLDGIAYSELRLLWLYRVIIRTKQ